LPERLEAGDLVDCHRGAGLAELTGFSVRVREALLSHLGWTHLVDLALSPSDAGRGRPWPDLVLTAALRTRVDAVARIGVIGDTASDLQAGTRAGASLVADVLTGAHSRAQLAAAPHTHIIDSIAQLPVLIT
jgi:phosphoglycolate phosphatase